MLLHLVGTELKRGRRSEGQRAFLLQIKLLNRTILIILIQQVTVG